MNVSVIFETLDEQGRRQQWLADRLGVSKHLLSKYRNGVRPMPEPLALRACELLGLPSAVLSVSTDRDETSAEVAA